MRHRVLVTALVAAMTLLGGSTIRAQVPHTEPLIGTGAALLTLCSTRMPPPTSPAAERAGAAWAFGECLSYLSGSFDQAFVWDERPAGVPRLFCVPEGNTMQTLKDSVMNYPRNIRNGST